MAVALWLRFLLGFNWEGKHIVRLFFFQDKRAFDEFTSGNFEFSAEASAVALTVSAQAKAGTSGMSSSQETSADLTKKNKARCRKGMVAMTLAKGGLIPIPITM